LAQAGAFLLKAEIAECAFVDGKVIDTRTGEGLPLHTVVNGV